jgi:hypothetical protein
MSGSIRLFVTAALAEGAEVAATADQAHYLANVMRRGRASAAPADAGGRHLAGVCAAEA